MQITNTLDGRLADIKTGARALLSNHSQLLAEFHKKTAPENLKRTLEASVNGYTAIAQSFLDLEFHGPVEVTPANEMALEVAEGMLRQLDAGVESLRRQIEALW